MLRLLNKSLLSLKEQLIRMEANFTEAQQQLRQKVDCV